jgi:hypothetical protein
MVKSMSDLAMLLGPAAPATWSLSHTFYFIGGLAVIGGGGFNLWLLWSRYRRGSLSLRRALWASGGYGLAVLASVYSVLRS